VVEGTGGKGKYWRDHLDRPFFVHRSRGDEGLRAEKKDPDGWKIPFRIQKANGETNGSDVPAGGVTVCVKILAW